MKWAKHGGNIGKLSEMAGIPVAQFLDFSANINPLGPPEWFRSLISSRVQELMHYPDPWASRLLNAAARHFGIDENEIVFGNGSTEILYAVPRALGKKRAVIPVPSYADYVSAAELSGLTVVKIPLHEPDGFCVNMAVLEKSLQGDELVVIGQPNNPTGLLFSASELRSLAERHRDTVFVVDEAFADFVPGLDRMIQNRPSNVLVLASLTKFYAMPGLRLGFAAGAPEMIMAIRRFMPPWSVNTLAQAVGEAALEDPDYGERTRLYVCEARNSLRKYLEACPGLFVYPGEANYLLVRMARGDMNASALADRLLKEGIAIRVCENFDGLDDRFFRVAVRTKEENERLSRVLDLILGGVNKTVAKRKTPAIMFQGTSSNAGKSVLSAALCRILLQDGYRVAPFKAQNMSLNSYVTADGGEMGRAQVVQAQAARLDPDVRMNPVLLKPSSDTGAQVIVMGRPVGNMNVDAYIGYKPKAFDAAKAAFDSLADEYDAVILEGAGSPAEVNLKSHDIVNMAMARYAASPVLLVGDIDRGGVFASFVGTMEVLAEWERALVAGFVINRFRGQESLLQDAIDYTKRHTGCPTFGIVPYLPSLGLPEEDSVTFKSGVMKETVPEGEAVDIAVVDLPHISNFTDFDSLRIEPDVRLRIVRAAGGLGCPDALILPGSKNVIADLDYLKHSGFMDAIMGLARSGKTEVIGICGGFQILGREIADPFGIESGGRTLAGLGLLTVTTTLAQEKTLKAASGKHVDSNLAVRGYEIHHGQTQGNGLTPVLIRDDGEVIGLRDRDGLCWGTYLHGIFDDDFFRRWFIDKLRSRRGLKPEGNVLAVYDLEPAFDRLADAVRRSLDMDSIYKLMGLK